MAITRRIHRWGDSTWLDIWIGNLRLLHNFFIPWRQNFSQLLISKGDILSPKTFLDLYGLFYGPKNCYGSRKLAVLSISFSYQLIYRLLWPEIAINQPAPTHPQGTNKSSTNCWTWDILATMTIQLADYPRLLVIGRRLPDVINQFVVFRTDRWRKVWLAVDSFFPADDRPIETQNWRHLPPNDRLVGLSPNSQWT